MQNLFPSPGFVPTCFGSRTAGYFFFFSFVDDLFFSLGDLDFFIYISNQLTNHVLLHQLLPDLGTLHRIS